MKAAILLLFLSLTPLAAAGPFVDLEPERCRPLVWQEADLQVGKVEVEAEVVIYRDFPPDRHCTPN